MEQNTDQTTDIEEYNTSNIEQNTAKLRTLKKILRVI